VSKVNTYTSAAALDLSQNTNSVSVLMTAAYLGSTPTTWTLDGFATRRLGPPN
jgi:hypothetical protein